LLHDNHATLVFVGDTFYNHHLKNYFDGKKLCTIARVEDIENNSQAWFDDHQFMAASSNVRTKYFLTTRIAHMNPHYFSVVGSGNNFYNLDIGYNTYIQNYNTAIFGDATIGNHCTVGNYNILSHQTDIGDYCHLSSYSFINFAKLGNGNCVALRTNILGKPGGVLNITNHCNFMINSVVTKDISIHGTYFGNRSQSGKTSVDYDVL
jgi:carbonic anhydrase/acetyltransferase-like protein (isoleucine patch superfamily)